MNTTPAAKNETKTVLLFSPDSLLRTQAGLQLLHIHRDGTKIDYTVSDINRREVKQHFAAVGEGVVAALLRFQPEGLGELIAETKARHKKQKAGIPAALFLQQSVYRHLHGIFTGMRTYWPQVKTYHKVRRHDTGAFQTQPCRFSNERLQLRFEVLNRNGLYAIATKVKLDEDWLSLEEFTRTLFFLQRDNVYYLLTYADFQTLEWLTASIGAGLQEEAFTSKILPRLLDGYNVDRNGLPEEKTLAPVPQCRVLLSELNNSFLLLTPQWLYDGILVEGPFRDEEELTIRGERLRIARHRPTEEAFMETLAALHPAFLNQRNGYFYLSFADAQKKQWFIRAWYQLLDLDVEVAGMDMLQHFRFSPHKVATELSLLREEGAFVFLQMKVGFGKESVSLHRLQKALYAGQRAVGLKDGTLGVLSDEWLTQYATMLKHGRVQEDTVQVSKLMALAGVHMPAEASVARETWQRQWQQWQTSTEPVLAVPPMLQAKLRPYQQKGFEWLALLSQAGAGACLADDMGLGKTLQTICFLAWYSGQHPGARHLIVCPTSLLYNWQAELRKFAPALKALIWHGAGREEDMRTAEIVITSYGTLRSNSEIFLAQNFSVAVVDESHNIKNPAAQISRIAAQLPAGIRIALSGTPVVNNTFDLYAQLSFAVPGLLGTREFFKREYADAIDRWGSEEKVKALQKLTAAFILRRTKEQVATDLPSRTESVLWCTMSPAQEEVYHEIREQVRGNLFMEITSNGLQQSKLAVLQGLLKLRQVCNHPALLPAAEHGGRLDSVKTSVLFEELSGLTGRHKVLLFSQFSSMLHLLAGECDRIGMRYFLLDGQTPAEKRAQMVQSFQESTDAPPLFLISLKAGNTGLTLTAADYVFLFDPWWNTAVEQQAIDRTHRIGQTRNVFAYKLVCRNTIEEKILELQQRKKKLADELVSAESDFVKNLGEEEITYLFS